jgi:tRNA threonylcarbamoyladenosine biosynthesis protein TsaB
LALLLHIDTATEKASVCISDQKQILAIEKSADQKNHASFLHEAVKRATGIAGITLQQLDAIAVTAGPGSYTGLRVGLSSAKGLCYALNKPLIAVNTLEVMAHASILKNSGLFEDKPGCLYCPMIDARRMEVFAAVYNSSLKSILKPAAVMLEENSFEEILKNGPVIFSGSGSGKFKNIITHPHAFFSQIEHDAADMLPISVYHFEDKRFTDLAYSEPLYLKEFFIK